MHTYRITIGLSDNNLSFGHFNEFFVSMNWQSIEPTDVNGLSNNCKLYETRLFRPKRISLCQYTSPVVKRGNGNRYLIIATP